MELDKLTCANCGAPVSPHRQLLHCEHCGTPYAVRGKGDGEGNSAWRPEPAGSVPPPIAYESPEAADTSQAPRRSSLSTGLIFVGITAMVVLFLCGGGILSSFISSGPQIRIERSGRFSQPVGEFPGPPGMEPRGRVQVEVEGDVPPEVKRQIERSLREQIRLNR